jgi:hypothetical protein
MRLNFVKQASHEGYIEIESKEKAGTKDIISIPHSVKKTKKMSKYTPYSFPQTPLVKIVI